MTQKEKVNKILLTGGHAATTALATVEELIRRNSKKKDSWDIVWVGVNEAFEGKDIKTLESEALPKMGVKDYAIKTGRLQRKFTRYTIPSLAKVPLGITQAIKIIKKEKPNVVLSFGGFASFPIVLAAYSFRIPIIIHEQTCGAGRANVYASKFAKKIALARKSSLSFFDSKKCKVVGNPVLTQITEIEAVKEKRDPLTIYIAGGSRGSISLNEIVGKIIKNLVNDYIVIHHIGSLWVKEAENIRARLGRKNNCYDTFERIAPMQIDGIYNRADIIVSRAGANTVSEIMIVKRPSLLIPLPISASHDQKANAQLAKEYGISKVLVQDDLTPEKLLKEIKLIDKNWNKIVSKVARKKSSDIHASQKLVNLVEEVLG
ncbi:glycosyltransferase [Patescibacteria group bacterium]